MRRSDLVLSVACLVAIGCRGESRRDANPVAASPAGNAGPRASAGSEVAEPAPLGACEGESSRQLLAPGLELLTLRPPRAAAIATGDPCLRVLRADPRHYKIVVGSQTRDGAARTAPAWARHADASAVINASMFHDEGRSTGLFIDRGEVQVAAVNSQFGAFFAADPVDAASPALALWGRGCPPETLAGLRRRYATIIQNYRLLDCEGAAIPWKDEKVYSAAAVGLDRQGRVLFIHSRAPYKMSTFTEILADPAMKLDLAAAMYVEGGPEATLFVEAGDQRALFVGSYETGFLENDDNAAAWPLPNVLMLVNKET